MSALTEARLRSIIAWVVIVLVGGPVGSAVLLGVGGRRCARRAVDAWVLDADGYCGISTDLLSIVV